MTYSPETQILSILRPQVNSEQENICSLVIFKLYQILPFQDGCRIAVFSGDGR